MASGFFNKLADISTNACSAWTLPRGIIELFSFYRLLWTSVREGGAYCIALYLTISIALLPA